LDLKNGRDINASQKDFKCRYLSAGAPRGAMSVADIWYTRFYAVDFTDRRTKHDLHHRRSIIYWPRKLSHDFGHYTIM